jgi:hypothetical protein
MTPDHTKTVAEHEAFRREVYTPPSPVFDEIDELVEALAEIQREEGK